MAETLSHDSKSDLPPGLLSSRLTRWVPPLLIVLAGLAAYANSFDGKFVFDDEEAIRGSELVQGENVSLEQLLRFQTFTTILTLRGNVLLNRRLGLDGLHLASFHAVNIVIHILAGLALFGLVRRTLLRPRLRDRFAQAAAPLALAASLLWMLHPVQTHSVTYLIQRKESLMGLLYLLTLYCFIRAAETDSRAGRQGLTVGRLASMVGWIVLAAISAALGVGAKQVAVTVPLIALGYDLVFFPDATQKTRLPQAIRRRWWGHVMIAGSAWSTAAWTSMHRIQEQGMGMPGLSAMQFAAAQPAAILRYLGVAVFPPLVCFDVNWNWAQATAGWHVLCSAIPLMALLAGSVWLLVRRPGWGFWAIWFFAILAPTSSFIVITELAFDHRVYLPLAGLAVLTVMCLFAGWSWLAGRTGKCSRLAPPLAIFAILAAVLGVLTFQRNELFRKPELLWADTIAKAPWSPRAHNNYGHELLSNGKLDDAMEQFSEAIRLYPSYVEACSNRGQTRRWIVESNRGRWGPEIRVGQLTMAVNDFERAISLNPKYAAAYNGVAFTCLEIAKERMVLQALAGSKGDIAEANSQQEKVEENFAYAELRLNRAIEINPKFAEAFYNRGLYHYRRAENELRKSRRAIWYKLALDDFDKAAALKPGLLDVHVPRSQIYLAQNPPRIDLARQELEAAISRWPKYAAPYRNLAEIHVRQREYDKALAMANKAIECDPNDALAYVRRGQALFNTGQYKAAMDDADRASRLDPDCQSATELKREILQVTGGRL